jgi:hypothetical protein
MTDVITTIVCTSAVAVNIRELSRRLGKVDLDGMFVRRLSATGSLPATHYISSGLIRPAYLNVFTDNVRLFNIAKAAWEDDGDVFPFTQLQVTNALAQCTVSDGTFNGDNESPHALIARLGLQLINDAP